MRVIFLVLAGLFLWSCDQTDLAWQYNLKNFFTTPESEIRQEKNLLTGKTYQRIKENSRNLSSQDQIGCNPPGKLGKDYQELENVLENFNQELSCTCRAFGSCSKEQCSCESLCPFSFAILRRDHFTSMADLSKPDNNLSFLNEPEMFKNVPMVGGYCSGMVALTQRFNRLAFFKPDMASPTNGPDSIEFYKKLIHKIAQNEPVEIPGFKNLYEFSSRPEIQELIADEVAGLWAQLNFDPRYHQEIADNFKARKNSEEMKEIIKNIKDRIDNNQGPIINIVGDDGQYHAVLVNHYEQDPQGKIKLCVKDPNLFANSSCLYHLKFNQKGELKYNMWDKKIVNIDIDHSEDNSTVEQVANLVAFCKKQKDCPL
jgi:hypothetical protein